MLNISQEKSSTQKDFFFKKYLTPEKQIILELTGMRIYDIIIIIKTQPPFGEKRSVLTNTTEKKIPP